MTEQSHTRHKQSILIVEDDPVNRQILAAIVGRMGHRVLEAASGLEGLNAAIRENPDLILLDIVMEGLDGYEVCRQLKKDPQTAVIPIIFISALREEQDEAKGLALGAVDYLFKPVSRTIAEARISTHLELKRHRDRLEEIVLERTRELHDVLSRLKVLKGLLPICASCKKIRDDKGTWNRMEEYIENRSEAEFSHGICPECARRLNPDIYDGLVGRQEE
ncbi:MAG: response regulator [Thermodesulfobacteriota bacterium]